MSYSIYNSWQGALTVSIAPSKQTLTFNLARPFNPQKGGKVEKGTKVYDWENSVFFAMTVDECQKFMDYWKAQNFQENFHLIHSSNNNSNFFNFSLSGDKFYLNIGPKGNQLSLSLAPEQISIIIKACNYMTSYMPWMADLLKEQGKMIDHKSSFNPGNGMDGKPYGEGQQNSYNPNNGNGQYNNYNNGGYQKRNYNNNNGYNQNNSYQQPPQPQQNFSAPKPPVPQPVQPTFNQAPQQAPVPAPAPRPVNNDIDDFTV